MLLKQFEGQDLRELSMVEVAYAILETREDVLPFNDLLILVQGYLQLPTEEIEERMTRFYTDLNIDGRFISVGDNRWGLRTWYPVDSIDEETVTSAEEDEELPRRRKKRNKLRAFGEEDLIDYNDDDPEEDDDVYGEYDDSIADDDDNEDDEDDDLAGLSILPDPEAEDDEEEESGTKELAQYQEDLSFIGETEVEEVDSVGEYDEEGSGDEETEEDF